MSRGKKLAVIGIGMVAVIVILAASQWYHRRYLWPGDIQNQVLGQQLAPATALIRYEGSSAYGEGIFRWYYRVDPGQASSLGLCESQKTESCRFTRSRRVREGVDLTVRYSNGVLLLEEVWS